VHKFEKELVSFSSCSTVFKTLLTQF